MNRNVLTVDDSAAIRELLAFTLRDAGYEVAEAVDGVDGLAQASARPFDLVITDYNMPRMDGIALVARLRELPAYRGVPILVLTTEASDEVKARGRAAGATGWLLKPFDPVRVVEVVRRVLG